ncbi:MAG: N-6 DNA methylase [Vampirovibrionales bacterium]|nr:N-6 DNA methylase [Vampirovibrionales bacterium]
MSHQSTFVKKLMSLEPSKTPQQKFWDLCEMAYCAYAKKTASIEKAELLESRYMAIVSSYADKDTVRAYPELLALICIGLQEGGDFLGEVAGELGALNGAQGQFFTPYIISRMMAEMTLGDMGPLINEKGYITVQEPAVGAGGMVLALAEVMRRRGFDPTEQLLVTAMDVSAQCYWMAYIQLTLAGIPAQVFCTNTLTLETFDSAWTVPALHFLTIHGDIWAERSSKKGDTPCSDVVLSPTQLALF